MYHIEANYYQSNAARPSALCLDSSWPKLGDQVETEVAVGTTWMCCVCGYVLECTAHPVLPGLVYGCVGATEQVSCIVVQQRANHSSAGTASVKHIVASGYSSATD